MCLAFVIFWLFTVSAEPSLLLAFPQLHVSGAGLDWISIEPSLVFQCDAFAPWGYFFLWAIRPSPRWCSPTPAPAHAVWIIASPNVCKAVWITPGIEFPNVCKSWTRLRWNQIARYWLIPKQDWLLLRMIFKTNSETKGNNKNRHVRIVVSSIAVHIWPFEGEIDRRFWNFKFWRKIQIFKWPYLQVPCVQEPKHQE